MFVLMLRIFVGFRVYTFLRIIVVFPNVYATVHSRKFKILNGEHFTQRG